MTAILDPRAARADAPRTATDAPSAPADVPRADAHVPPAEPISVVAPRLRARARPALLHDLRHASGVAAAGLVLAAGVLTAALVPSQPIVVALVSVAVAVGCALLRRRVVSSLADLLLRPSAETTKPPQAGLVL